jgi:hypothetical protein
MTQPFMDDDHPVQSPLLTSLQDKSALNLLQGVPVLPVLSYLVRQEHFIMALESLSIAACPRHCCLLYSCIL